MKKYEFCCCVGYDGCLAQGYLAPQRFLFFTQTLEEACLNGRSAKELYTRRSWATADCNLTQCPSAYMCIYVTEFNRLVCLCAVGVSAEWRPGTNCHFSAADWCLLPSKRLSGSLERLHTRPWWESCDTEALFEYDGALFHLYFEPCLSHETVR